MTRYFNPNLHGYELFIEAMASIKVFPNHHNQSTWACDSGMCLAGWAGSLIGYYVRAHAGAFEDASGFRVGNIDSIATDLLMPDAIRKDGRTIEDVRNLFNNGVYSVDEYETSLFDATNSYADLVRRGSWIYEKTMAQIRRDIADRITNGPILRDPIELGRVKA